MRIALIADIHSNLEALEAVLRDVERRGPVDAWWCLGDIVGYGPDPAAWPRGGGGGGGGGGRGGGRGRGGGGRGGGGVRPSPPSSRPCRGRWRTASSRWHMGARATRSGSTCCRRSRPR